MRRDTGNIVASVSRVFDIEAGLARNSVALDSAQELSAFARKHGPNDQLEEASEVGLVVLARGQPLLDRQTRVLQEVLPLAEGLLGWQSAAH